MKFRSLFRRLPTSLFLSANPNDFPGGEGGALAALEVFLSTNEQSLWRVTGDSIFALAGDSTQSETSWREIFQDKLFQIDIHDKIRIQHFLSVAYRLLDATVWDSNGKVVFGVADGDTGYYRLTPAEYSAFHGALSSSGIGMPTEWPNVLA